MNATTIRQFIETLEQVAEQYGDDTAIMTAHQPNYPLAELVSGICVTAVDSNGHIQGSEDTSPCMTEGCSEDAVVYNTDTERAYCDRHARENGVDPEQDLSGYVAWLVVTGTPGHNDLWTSPYAPNVFDEVLGDSYNLR